MRTTNDKSKTINPKPSRRFWKRVLWLCLVLFFIMNITAFLHAWRFTHFTDGHITKPKAEGVGWGLKIKYAFTGMPNPRPENKTTPSLPFEKVQLNDKYSTAGWWVPCDNAIGTIILLHGYGGEKSGMLDKSTVFHEWGYNTLLIDFRGSGETAGNATSIGFYEAEQVKYAFEWALANSEKPVSLFGTSMGAAAAMRAVAKYDIKPAGLILECPFGTLSETTKARFRQMGIPSFPMSSLLVFWGGVQQGFNGFKHNPADYAKAIDIPTLLMYGQKDAKVSQAETDEIYSNLKGPKSFFYFPEAGHENYLNHYNKEWREAVGEFLNNTIVRLES